jgi:hypothetical protein
MAGNKPFANLDRLAQLARPDIIPFTPNVQQGDGSVPKPFEPEINQGKPSNPVYTPFEDKLNLADRYKQPQYGTTNHLAQFQLSDIATYNGAYTNFRKTISLGNRLDQPDIGSTNHLAQFFLSDSFTGFIRIKPTTSPQSSVPTTVAIVKPSAEKTIEEQGSTTPQRIAGLIVRGGTIPTPAKSIKFIRTRQGIKNSERYREGVLTNDIIIRQPSSVEEKLREIGVTPILTSLISHIVLETPTTVEEKLSENGVFENNRQLYSTVAVNDPIEEVAQGGTDLTDYNPAPPNQGGQDPTQAKTVEQLLAAQGINTTTLELSSFITLTEPAEEVSQGIFRIGTREFSNVEVKSGGGGETPNQGIDATGTNSFVQITLPPTQVAQGDGSLPPSPTPPIQSEDNVVTRQGTIELQTLRYLAGSLVLQAAPEIYQGGEPPQNEIPGDATHGSHGGHDLVDTRSALIAALLNPAGGTEIYSKADLTTGIPLLTTSIGGGLDRYDNVGDVSSTIQYANTLPYTDQAARQKAIDLLNDEGGVDAYDQLKQALPPDSKFADLTKQDNLSKNSSVKDLVDADGQSNKNVPIADALGTTGDPNTVEVQVIGLLNNKITTSKIQDYKKGYTVQPEVRYLAGPSPRKYTDIQSYEQLSQLADAPPTSEEFQLKTVKIGSLTFDAFIKSYSDGVTANYQDFKHIGQMDVFKVYVGATRQIGLSFAVVAMKGTTNYTNSNKTAKQTLEAVDKLMRVCTIGTPSGNYIKGPVVDVSVAGLFTDLKCVCGSVKVDVEPADTPWDVDSGIPHLFNVSLDLTPLAMAGGGLLNSDGNFYGG